jgi:hypothetical protein
MPPTPFGSERVITQHFSNADFNTFFVGFDINGEGQRYYRIENLVELLQKVIPEFAFGHHEGTSISLTEVLPKLREAARSIYKIESFSRCKEIYERGKHVSDDDAEKCFLQRGEFGELILHLLLRDFHKTIPLLSKIHFKDDRGSPVHGFDAVHIQPDNKSLWLGESKIYIDGRKGVKALTDDVKSHFKGDYLRDEFAIISKKLKPFDNIPEKDYWLSLMDSNTKLETILSSVTIPLLCTYSSDNFTKYNDEALPEFIREYEKEVLSLKEYFDENRDKSSGTNLNVILLLFPVRCKNELVKRMHEKLETLQGI